MPRRQSRLLNPSTVDLAAYAGDPGTLVAPRAGEMLFRLG